MKKFLGILLLSILLIGASAFADDTDLILHYEFEDASLVVDSTGNYNGGILSANAKAGEAPLQLSLNGLSTGGVDLSLGGAYITIPGTEGLDLQSMTVSVWMKGEPASNWSAIVAKYGESSQGWQFRRGGNGSGNLSLTLRGVENNDGNSNLVPEMTDGRWHHYAAAHDSVAGITNYYVDGQLFQTITGRTGAVTPTVAPICVGARINASGGIEAEGKVPGLDDVRIYSRALTDAEIAEFCPAPAERADVTSPTDGYYDIIDFDTDTIQWNEPTEGDVSGYNVWILKNGDPNWVQVGTMLASGTSSLAFPEGMEEEVSYDVRVDVVDPTGFIIAGKVSTFISAIPPVTLTYDFNDGTLQGWENVGPGPDAWRIDGQVVGFSVREGNDGYHSTMILRSPTFKLNGDTDLSAYFDGGPNVSDITGYSSADLPLDTDGSPAFKGLALRDVATDTYVAYVEKTTNGGGYVKYALGLDELNELDQNAVYCLDLIDTHAGGWGWIKMDDVTIPGVEWVYPLAINPSPENGFVGAGSAIGDGTADVELSWDAGLDPNDNDYVYPGISEHYVFMTDGTGDPNLFYLGTVSQTQPTADPRVSLGIVNVLEGREYSWVVVEALAGKEQTFTASSTIDDVDPANLTGGVWSFIASADGLTYDFDDNTLQGWTNVGPGDDAWKSVNQRIEDGFGDNTHSTLILRSPEFTFTGIGYLQVTLYSGRSDTDNESVVGYKSSELPADTTDVDGVNAQGMALRDVATDTYVYFIKKSFNGPEPDTISIPVSELDVIDLNSLYTLDLIDSREGSWAHTQMDDVFIPGLLVSPANAPDPANNELDVEVDLADRAIAGTLSWLPPVDTRISEVLGYNVYVDTDMAKVENAVADTPDTLFSSIDQPQSEFIPGEDLAYSSTYYWRVDSIVKYVYDSPESDPNIIAGPVWTFDTFTLCGKDLTGDCYVNISDIEMLTNDWLVDLNIYSTTETSIEDFEAYADTVDLIANGWGAWDNETGVSTVSLVPDSGNNAMQWTYDNSATNVWCEVLYAMPVADTGKSLIDYSQFKLKVKRHAGNSQEDNFYFKILDSGLTPQNVAAEYYIFTADGSTYADPDQWIEIVFNISDDVVFPAYSAQTNGYYSVGDVTNITGLVIGCVGGNGTGTIDIDDISFVTLPGCTPDEELISDINQDCIVNLEDFAALAQYWLLQ